MRKKPDGYGKYWSKKRYKSSKQEKNFLEWYQWMYQSRIEVNEEFVTWVFEKGCDINSIADFGCGIGIGFSDHFKDKIYIGVDISKRNIDWCKSKYNNKKHSYLCMDFISDTLPEKADVVICNGTLENVWDINRALKSMVAGSKKWIYASCFRGWFPNLKNHKYVWVEKQKVYSSFVSPEECQKVLEDMGCEEIEIFPFKKKDNKSETIVIARVPY